MMISIADSKFPTSCSNTYLERCMTTINFKQLKDGFQKDGYVFIANFLDVDEIKNINARLDAYIKETVLSMPDKHVFYEDKSNRSTIKQLQDMHLYDTFFAAYLHKSRFEELAEILLDEKVSGRTIEYFNKPPKIGKATPPHQDGYYFMITPQRAVTMWMALENVDEQNGCVRYIKGTHLKGMRPHGRTTTTGFSQGISDYGEKDFADEIPFPAKPGDLLVHHSMTIHRADANSSDTRSRKALGLIYFGESAREDLEAKRAYQKILADESAAANA